MLMSMAWRNLARRRWLSVITGGVAAFGILLAAWIVGMNYGGYDQMIDSAVRTRLGHLQVLPEGYIDEPEARLVVPNAEEIHSKLAALNGVRGASARALAEGMLARDSESSAADLVGVVPEDEAAASVVPEGILQGKAAVDWCRTSMADAIYVLGGDEELFDRWCQAAGEGQFLPEGDERSITIGSGMAEQLLVSVGDEVTVQVVRVVDEAGEEGGGSGDGAVAGDLSQRRLEVSGIFRVGNPEVDDRMAFVHLDTLTDMLGTDGPNEVVVLLDDIERLETVRADAASIVRSTPSTRLYSWAERNAPLSAMIEADAAQNWYMFGFLCVLVILGVINTTFMSVMWRTREFGVMLSLGLRRGQLFSLIMLEVAFLGAVAVLAGAVLGGGLEAFGRIHGWNLEWFGMDPENFEVAGVMYDPVFYSRVSLAHGAAILLGTYAVVLLAGVLPALKASRLEPVQAMRHK